MSNNLRQAQLRFDALAAPHQTFRPGKCWAEIDVEVYIEMDRTEDGELDLTKAELVLDGGKHIVPFNEEGLKTLIKLNEQEMAEEAQVL